MYTIEFRNCRVDVYPAQKYLVTIFLDGTSVEATPNYTEEDLARAESLGYGNDTWAMTLDHEIGHSVLAEMDNLPYSPALWAVAHPEERCHSVEEDELFYKEECRVLELQRFHRLMNNNLSNVYNFNIMDVA